MCEGIDVLVARSVDHEVVAALQRLVPQLSTSAAIPDASMLSEIVASPNTAILLARDRNKQGHIVGSLTLVVFRVPTGIHGLIEDVVVDQSDRGKGVGEALCREALRIAAERGARTVDLTSRAFRLAANRLYQRLGFRLRDTNVYRYTDTADGNSVQS